MKEKDITSVITDIIDVFNECRNKQLLKSASGDVLSYMATKLAALKGALLDVKVDAHREVLRLEVELETAKGRAYAKYKASDGATAASDMKNMDEDYIKAKQAYNEAKVNYEKLKSIVADSHDLIDSIKSRVIDMQGARRDERS